MGLEVTSSSAILGRAPTDPDELVTKFYMYPQPTLNSAKARLYLMPYAPKIILQLPLSNEEALSPFVETCLRDSVSLIAVNGFDASYIEDLIDELIVGDGSDPARSVTTTAHPDESLEKVLEFAATWKAELGGEVQLVRL